MSRALSVVEKCRINLVHHHYCGLGAAPAASYSPVLHAGVAPNGLLHVGVALRCLAGPGPVPGLNRALGDIVAVASLPAASSTAAASSSSPSATSSSPSLSAAAPNSSTAAPRRRGGAKATQSVLTATLEVVLSAGERHLHPDPSVLSRPDRKRPAGGRNQGPVGGGSFGFSC